MKGYNLTRAQELTDGDAEFMRTLVQTFLEEIPADLAAMNEAIENENAALTYQIAHKMKPNLYLFGLDVTQEIQKLEAWEKSQSTKAEILVSAKSISDAVFRAATELKKDFDL